jgi:hypothetical protein
VDCSEHAQYSHRIICKCICVCTSHRVCYCISRHHPAHTKSSRSGIREVIATAGPLLMFVSEFEECTSRDGRASVPNGRSGYRRTQSRAPRNLGAENSGGSYSTATWPNRVARSIAEDLPHLQRPVDLNALNAQCMVLLHGSADQLPNPGTLLPCSSIRCPDQTM